MLFYAIFSILVAVFLIVNPIITIFSNKKYRIELNLISNIILSFFGVCLLVVSILSLVIKLEYEFIFPILMILITVLAILLMHFSRKK